MLNSGLSRAQSLSHCCRVQYAGPAQQCIADSSALGVVLWSWANEGTFTVDKGTLQTTVMRCPKQASGGRTPDCDGAPPGVSSSKRLLRTEGGQAETFQNDPKRWAIVNGRVPRPTAETVQSTSNQIDQAWPPPAYMRSCDLGDGSFIFVHFGQFQGQSDRAKAFRRCQTRLRWLQPRWLHPAWCQA